MIAVRNGLVTDLPAALELIKELALFEKVPEAVEVSLSQLVEDFEAGHFQFFVAVSGQVVVGMALYMIGYSTWKGKIVYLDDLVVTENYRQQGIGTLLMNALKAEAKRLQAKQFRWHVLDWNAPAIAMYKKMNAELDDEWITCKLTAQQL